MQGTDQAEAVIHLAAHLSRGSAAEQLPGTAEAASTNVGAVLLALRMARLAGARSFVHISSLSVFSGYGSTPIPAGARPDATGIYGFTKRLAEHALRSAAEEQPPTREEGSITVTSLRLAYPTTAADWPRWKSPVVPDQDAEMIRMDDGTAHVAMHPEDQVAAVRAALDRARGGVFEAIAVTAAPHAIDDDAAERLRGRRRRHVKEPGA